MPVPPGLLDQLARHQQVRGELIGLPLDRLFLLAGSTNVVGLLILLREE
jgi:hypothetical protein